MENYLFEEGANIDFYSELYKSLDDCENINLDNVCLITNEPLTDNHVTLGCNHKFNYIPLYNDILNFKTKFKSLENIKYGANEIRCPYCRTKLNELLPYYELKGVKKIHGVNWLDTSNPGALYTYPSGICNFTNNGILTCPFTYVSKLDLDCKTYCYYHKKILLKQHLKKLKKEVKLKEIEEKKKLKEEEKLKKLEEKKKLKEEEKLKKLEEKKKQKEEEKLKKLEEKKKLKEEEKLKKLEEKKKVKEEEKLKKLEEKNKNK
jgi:hypothetical protein